MKPLNLYILCLEFSWKKYHILGDRKEKKIQEETNRRKRTTDYEILKFKVCDLKTSVINTFKKIKVLWSTSHKMESINKNHLAILDYKIKSLKLITQ